MSRFGDHPTGSDKDDIMDAVERIFERDGYDEGMLELIRVMEYITDSSYYRDKYRRSV